jgi:hypothetical protein
MTTVLASRGRFAGNFDEPPADPMLQYPLPSLFQRSDALCDFSKIRPKVAVADTEVLFEADFVDHVGKQFLGETANAAIHAQSRYGKGPVHPLGDARPDTPAPDVFCQVATNELTKVGFAAQFLNDLVAVLIIAAPIRKLGRRRRRKRRAAEKRIGRLARQGEFVESQLEIAFGFERPALGKLKVEQAYHIPSTEQPKRPRERLVAKSVAVRDVADFCRGVA